MDQRHWFRRRGFWWWKATGKKGRQVEFAFAAALLLPAAVRMWFNPGRAVSVTIEVGWDLLCIAGLYLIVYRTSEPE